MKLVDVLKELETAEGYMVSISLLRQKGGAIDHYLFTEKFPAVDMLPAQAQVEKLVVNELRNPGGSIPPITSRGASPSSLEAPAS